MKAIVTGGAGFIGSAVTRLLAGAGWDVAVIDSLTYAGTRTSLAMLDGKPGFSFHKHDICDAPAVREVFRAHQPDAVFHLAAESHVDRSITGPAAFVTTNVVGTQVMLEAARDYWSTLDPAGKDRFRFLHASTDEVYGSLSPIDPAFHEETRYDPSSPYAASKAAADHLAQAWSRTYRLPVIVSNCSNNYGPYHFPEKLIPLVILNALEGKSLPVYGDGGQVRDWLHVDDHAAALKLIVETGKPCAKYNVGARAERTNLQVVQAICDLVDELAGLKDRRALIRFVEDRPGHDRRYAIDPSKLERELGWRPQQTFEAGLRVTVEWFLANEAWWAPLRARYQGERLGTLGSRQGG